MLYETKAAFIQQIQPNTAAQFFIVTRRKLSISFNFRCTAPDTYFSIQNAYELFSGFNHGVILLIVFLSVVCAVFFRMPVFLLFGSFVFMSLLNLMRDDGSLVEIILHQPSYLFITIIQSLLAISFISFSVVFLKIHKNNHSIAISLFITAAVYTATVVMEAVYPWVWIHPIPKILVGILMIYIIATIIILAFINSIQKDKSAVLYLTALSPLVLYVLFHDFYAVVLHKEIGVIGIEIGLVIMSLIMPMAVFYQMHKIRQEKEGLRRSVSQKVQNIISLKKIDSMKNDFISSVTHDYRSPISGIISLSNVLLTSEVSKEKQEEYVKLIYITSMKLKNNTDRLLDAMKLNEEAFSLSLSKVNILEKIKDILSVFQPLLLTNGITITGNILEIEECTIVTDEKKLEEAVTNIISNAVKFAPQRHGEISINRIGKENKIIIRIEDNGIGIDPVKLQSIFGKYSKERNNAKIEGSGLGLYHARRAVESLGGTVVAESEGIGSGSVFQICIPRNSAETKTARPYYELEGTKPKLYSNKNLSRLLHEAKEQDHAFSLQDADNPEIDGLYASPIIICINSIEFSINVIHALSEISLLNLHCVFSQPELTKIEKKLSPVLIITDLEKYSTKTKDCRLLRVYDSNSTGEQNKENPSVRLSDDYSIPDLQLRVLHLLDPD